MPSGGDDDDMCDTIDCQDPNMAQDPCCMPSGSDDGDDQCDAIDCNDSSFAQDPCCMPSGGEKTIAAIVIQWVIQIACVNQWTMVQNVTAALHHHQLVE